MTTEITVEQHIRGPGRRQVELSSTEGPVRATLIASGATPLVRILSHPAEWTETEAYNAVRHAVADGRIR